MPNKIIIFLVILSVFVFGIVVVVSGGKIDTIYPENNHPNSQESNQEDLSKYFENKDGGGDDILLPTNSRESEARKCEIGTNVVVEGTVIDGTTCIVQ